MVSLAITLGAIFCPVAAVAAFLITYDRYLRGRNPDKKLALKIALQSALIALAIFGVIIVVIAVVVPRIVAP